jgi:hypothetical protein
MQNHQGVFRLMEIPLLGRRFPPQKMGLSAYLHRMFKAFEFCLPTKSTIVPGGPTGSTRSNMTATYFASSAKVIARA